MTSINRGNAKLFAAVIGGSALVAFGAMSVEIAQHAAEQDSVMGADATVGAIPAPVATTTAAVYALQPMSAAPAITGRAPYFPGESPNHTL